MIILFYHSMAFASGREYRATAYTTVMGSAVQTFVQRTMERKPCNVPCKHYIVACENGLIKLSIKGRFFSLSVIAYIFVASPAYGYLEHNNRNNVTMTGNIK